MIVVALIHLLVIFTTREDYSLCVCLSVCVPNRFLNHASQQDQTLHEGVNPGKVTVKNNKIIERDFQNSNKSFKLI